MKNLILLVVVASMTLFAFSGCKNDGADSAANPAAELGAEVDPESLPKVDVPEDGIEFDPSVAVAQLPDGVWTCDMGGLSHYAAHDKKDGKCPVCHMNLVQKTAAAE